MAASRETEGLVCPASKRRSPRSATLAGTLAPASMMDGKRSGVIDETAGDDTCVTAPGAAGA